ncbi:MAG: hypothetical protein AAFR41_08810 [Pseudomonadota bacterium]
MSDSADTELIELVAQEQRGLRGILVAGFSATFVVVAMSVALGVYYFFVAQALAADSERLERQAFDTRIMSDNLADQISDQDARLRRTYAEMLDATDTGVAGTSDVEALDVASAYLKLGVRSLTGEKQIERTIQQAEPSTSRAVLAAILALMEWERSGTDIVAGDLGLPGRLDQARQGLIAGLDTPETRTLAQTGLAWIAFETASSPRSNYAVEDCEAVFDATARIGPLDTIGLQPLYWRGQCARKLGRVEEALRSYSLAVQSGQSIDVDEIDSLVERDALLTLELNAFHGLGTVLIASENVPDSDALSAARALAGDVCEPGAISEGSERTRLMHACLQKAISIRRRLRQTDNQVSGSGENLSFVFLIDDDYQRAAENTAAVERTGLFAWNELLRATVARELGNSAAETDARRNVSFFNSRQFNACEIRKLLKPAHFELALDILLEEHPDLAIDC